MGNEYRRKIPEDSLVYGIIMEHIWKEMREILEKQKVPAVADEFLDQKTIAGYCRARLKACV